MTASLYARITVVCAMLAVFGITLIVLAIAGHPPF